ncbi:sensor histidine kinase [Catenovulum sediminis]|uniref:sensor histidine kinase n=1 Tax=Catenovulum sediminis TaxID=1740262 RepID=UPI00117D37EE|nr:HAMP domain-containing sensor histidine kinase [Catenovulum sediminis]
MRIKAYLKSLRVRIVLAFATLALVSSIGYSFFAWFIFDVTDDRLFNWYALEISRHAQTTQQIPLDSVNRRSLVGSEFQIVQFLTQEYGQAIHPYAKPPYRFEDLLGISHKTAYPDNYIVYDFEGSAEQAELQVVVSPWQQQKLYVIYDISGFDSGSDPSTFNADKFVLLILVPLAILITLLAVLLSMGLTRSVLKPLTNLAKQVEKVDPQRLPKRIYGQFFPDEVGSLANTLSTLMKRIGEYVDNEKRFSREVSHELRTPTTSLTMALDLLQNTQLDETQAKLAGRMHRATSEMTQLINTFLLLAKNNPDQHQTEIIPLFPLVEQVIDKLSYLLASKDVAIINELDKHAQCQANRTLLEIVLSNLLRNAFQYTHTGQVRVHFKDACLSVQDTGFGIPASEINNINQAFYSLQPDGVGLGMSIVQRIVWQLGWKLEVVSEAGEGTEVKLCID